MRKVQRLDRRVLILLSIVPVACLAAILVGLFVSWDRFPTQIINAEVGDMGPAEAEQFVILVAAEYAADGDLARASERLAELDVPNPEQFVSFLADRYIQEGRDKDDPDLINVINLARDLGSGTRSQIAYISTPTPSPTFTPLPTSTRTVTSTPRPTHTPSSTPAPTNTPIPVTPTSTPAPPTETPTPAPPTATFTPAPPTATPTPTTPPVDFVVSKVRMLSMQENGGCRGGHQIYVTVVDAGGTPLNGVTIGDTFNNPAKVSGEKGPGRADFDMYKNGFELLIKGDPSAGRPVSSQVTMKLSTNDWEIPIDWLVAGGYCSSHAECTRRWNSGVDGVGENSLCWGHYSYEVTFQRTF